MTIIFDTNVLNIICKHIDDPKTFLNFSLVCTKTRNITRSHKEQKMDQFSIETSDRIPNSNNLSYIGKYFNRTSSKLPNGNLHGYQTVNSGSLVGHTIYYNGIALVAFVDDDMDVNIFVCQCTKQVPEDYVYNKLNTSKDKWKEKIGACKYNCRKCNTGIERVITPIN